MEFSDEAIKRFILSPRNILRPPKYFKIIFYENRFPMQKIGEIKDRLILLARIFRESKGVKNLIFYCHIPEGMILASAIYRNGNRCKKYFCCDVDNWEMLVEKMKLVRVDDYYVSDLLS